MTELLGTRFCSELSSIGNHGLTKELNFQPPFSVPECSLLPNISSGWEILFIDALTALPRKITCSKLGWLRTMSMGTTISQPVFERRYPKIANEEGCVDAKDEDEQRRKR
uniref:Uncharacterized protein n=1 Tax=Spongospora subterranea TaxID=70186 RepID=A0A0H5RDI3_9EUKA|eukprot:CRZ11796.1 hypothetical protein [Spongospora subterranea]